MWRPILLMLCGTAFVAGARVLENSNRKSLDAEVRGIAMLRTRVDSVSALYSSATTAADSARFKKELDERINGVGRRQFHVPLREEMLAAWWTPTGTGTLLSVPGVLIMLVGLYVLRRTARAQRRD